MANASIYVSRVSSSCFLLLWEALQDQQVGLTQAPFKCPAAAKLLQSCPTLCTPVFLPGESQGQGSLMGCRLWGHTELDMTEAT